MNTVKWSITKNSELFGPCLEDGLLKGVVSEGESVKVYAKNAYDIELTLFFSGVQWVLLNDFLAGNIIGRVWVFESRTDILNKLTHGFPFLRSSTRSAEEAEIILNKNPEISLFHLEPCYGAELYIAFKDLVICSK